MTSGDTVLFTLDTRIAACTAALGGDCDASLNTAGDRVTVIAGDQDCQLEVTFSCQGGGSHIELRPEHIGVLWANRSQQFTATQVFGTGERVDITHLVSWSSSNSSVVSIAPSGVATAVVNHGIVDITAEDLASRYPLSATTDMTVVNVSGWLGGSPDCTNWTPDSVYLYDAVFSQSTSWMTWKWTPDPAGVWTANDGIFGRLWYFWSEDGGLTYRAHAWDWIGSCCGKRITNPHTLSMWMGVMVSSVGCTPSGWCSPEFERSNIFFAEGF